MWYFFIYASIAMHLAVGLEICIRVFPACRAFCYKLTWQYHERSEYGGSTTMPENWGDGTGFLWGAFWPIKLLQLFMFAYCYAGIGFIKLCCWVGGFATKFVEFVVAKINKTKNE